MSETPAPYRVDELAAITQDDQALTHVARMGECVGVYFVKLQESGIAYKDAVKLTRNFQELYLCNSLGFEDAVLTIDIEGMQ